MSWLSVVEVIAFCGVVMLVSCLVDSFHVFQVGGALLMATASLCFSSCGCIFRSSHSASY
jgi:hypothetical protein